MCVDVFHVKNRAGIREEDELQGRTKKRGGEWWRVQGMKFIKGVKKEKEKKSEYLPGRCCRIAPSAIQPVEQSLHSSPLCKRSYALEPIKKFGN